MAKHQHEAKWVMGQYPIAATCRGCKKVLIATNPDLPRSGEWVSVGQASAVRRSIGTRAAL